MSPAPLLAIIAIVAQPGPLTHMGTLSESLSGPARIAVAVDGTVLVTDPLENHIARFDAAGVFIETWPVPEGPIGVAIDVDGRILVSRRDDAKVAIYDATFVFQNFLGDGVVTFVKPTDLDIAADTGQIYVVDSGADLIYYFDNDGSNPSSFGIRGELPGQLQYPSAIAIDETNGLLVVADHDNFRIQTFTPSGFFLQRIGYRVMYMPGGGQEGWMPRSQGVAVDADGYMYLSDAMMSTVRIISPTGTDLGKVVTYGSTSGDLRTPCDLALSPDGSRLYVVSTNTATVEVYATPVLGGAAAMGFDEEGPQPTGTNLCTYDMMRLTGSTLRAGEVSGDWHSKKPFNVDRTNRVSRLNHVDALGSVAASFDGPHFIDSSNDCGRCHGIYGQPGVSPNFVEGQTAICLSCHSSGGQALAMPFPEASKADPFSTNPEAVDGRGTSHAWGVSAINSSTDSAGPTPGGIMDQYLDGGLIKCTTCHNQHDPATFSPYLRVNNAGDAMCKECHAARNQGPGEGGSHPVGFDYPGGVGEFPADVALSPLALKSGNVECSTCHGIHNVDSGGANAGEGDGMLLRTTNDEFLCQTCHANHVIHTPGGDWQPTCLDCHDPHDPDNANLSLVAGVVNNQTLAVGKPVVFTAQEGSNSFDDGDPANYDGICQVCHTATSYHTQDGTGASHHDGENCTSCHPHDAGFMPTGGSCIDCHAAIQDNGDGIPVGGRRAVVGEFPIGDAHSHYGTELTSGACTVCHDQTTHMDGKVDLIDADSGALYTFVNASELSSDPDLSTFCSSCHDGDGATRLGVAATDPFGSGNVPPNVAEKFQGTLRWDEWYGDFCFGNEGTLRQVNSHHDISDSDQAWSGAKLECMSCHGAHTAGSTQPVSDPFSPNTATPWTGSTNAFCLECHYGGFGPTEPGFPVGVTGPTVPLRPLDTCDSYWAPWWVQYSWTHAAHGQDSKRGWEDYSGAPGAEVDCVSCHDPHGSYTATNTEGNPYAIRDVVDGTVYVDDGVRPSAQWTGPPWDDLDSQGMLKDPVHVTISGATVGWGELCVACHADWLAAYSWHDFCNGCQTCHGHGQAWQNNDWGGGVPEDTLCPHNNHCTAAAEIILIGDVCDEASENVGDPCTFDSQCLPSCDEASDVPGSPCTNDTQCPGGLCGTGLCDHTYDANIAGDTTVADDDNITVCGGSDPTKTIWYSIVGTGNTLSATTCSTGTAFDTNIRVFCDTCDALTCVTSNDDDALCGLSGVASTVIWCSDPGQTYLIQVGGANAEFGLFELFVSDGVIPCGTPDGCAAVPAPSVAGDGLEVSPKPVRLEPQTAPHPDDGRPVLLHGANAGR